MAGGAALCMLVLVSAFVAFGSWPGETSGRQVDQVLLNEVTGGPKAKAVSVRSDAVKVAQRAEARRQVAQAKREGQSGKGGRTRDATQVGKTPAGGAAPTTAAGTPLAAVPKVGGDSPAATVKQQTQDLTQNVDSTTKTVTNQVQTQVDQTTTQVNQVVDQVVNSVPPPVSTTIQPVGDTVTTTTGAVKGTVGDVLGH
jgi:hypothetical protein